LGSGYCTPGYNSGVQDIAHLDTTVEVQDIAHLDTTVGIQDIAHLDTT
jgi:hypothetical protein